MADLTRNERRSRRLQQLLVELERNPEGLPWPELWARIVAAVPEVAEDREVTTTGALKGETDVRWHGTTLDKAGWVLTGANRLRITAAGRAALRAHPDPEELLAASNLGYAQWRKLRDDARSEPLDGDAGGGLLPIGVGEPAVRRVAGRILADGLRAGGSAFSASHQAWAAGSVDELHAAVVSQDSFAAGSDSFDSRLQGRLAGCSDTAILLCAEILALQMLPVADLKQDTKRGRVKRVLGHMREPVAMSSDVNAAMQAQVFNGGLTFKTMIWKALSTGIEVARAWWRLDDAGRDRAWADPWAWRDLVESAQGDTGPAARAELRYLAHPATFPPIISVRHQRMIRDALAAEAGIAPTDDPDRDLLAITMALQRSSGAAVDYYESPLHARWSAQQPARDPEAPAATPAPAAALASSASPAQPHPGRRAWLIRGSSVKGVDITGAWAAEGFVSLAASQLPPLSLPAEPAEIGQAVADGYAHLSYAKREEKLRDISGFLQRVETGDLVLTTSGGNLRFGEVTGPAASVVSENGLSNLRRPARWLPDAVVDFADLPPELAGRLRSGSDLTDLTEVVAVIEQLLTETGDGDDGGEGDGPPRPADVAPLRLAHLPADVADQLLVGRKWLVDLVDLLAERRQVILYGPPGTGKTYLAQKVAEALAPPENIKLVQFHPAYSYEDFFEGYRPVQLAGGQVGFKLKAGPFRRIVEDALEHPEQPYLLIVDEINRANLAKVFGELYFLLEYRDAAIDLLYSEDSTKQFQLPKNVFIIGTMNTADRSIALVDAAMRRRFAFLSLHPTDEHLRGVLTAWLAREEHPTEPAELLALLNARIPDRELAVGPSYLMNAGVATPEGLDRIWRTQILPLLAEYHVGEGLDVERQYGLPALRRELAALQEPDENPPA
jgi:5-methylcytosine-specific restriction enzyme B